MKSKLLTLAVLLCSIVAFTTACGSKLKLSEESLEMEQYETLQLTVEGGEEVEWESSDPRTVKVEDGLLTSLSLGNATITATAGEQSVSCEVTVIPATKGRTLLLDQEEITLEAGATTEVTASLKEDGEDVEADLIWSSSVPEIAMVDNGTISAVAGGTAEIKVETVYKGQVFSATVKVTVPGGAADGKITSGLYIANGEDPQIRETSGKITDGEYSGWYEKSFMTDIWGERLQIGKDGISNVFAVGPKYREYGYYGFDIIFKNDVSKFTIWNGGKAIFLNGTNLSVEDGEAFNAGDLDITTADGASVLGTQLKKDVAYTFKIRIQKDNLDNGAFGIGVEGSGTFLIGNPYFMPED